MKKLVKLLLIVALGVSTLQAEKVKLFDLSKTKLVNKEKNKLTTYKLGSLTLKTDLDFVEDAHSYYKGTRLEIKLPDFVDSYFLIDKNIRCCSTYIYFKDEFGEFIKIELQQYGNIKINNQRIKDSTNSRAILKFKILKDKIQVYESRKLLGEVSTQDMEKIVSVDMELSDVHLFNLMIVGEN